MFLAPFLLLPLLQALPARSEPPAADRAAILAMAGAYEVRFRFEETVACAADYIPHEPYTADAMELVEVVADEPGFIRLQHLLVLAPKGPHGNGEPQVIKHWRQDWTWEDAELCLFRGYDRWERVQLEPEQSRGTWSQAVFEVSDSPRYEALGRWTHTAGRSAWSSEETWRPLPRREYTQRMDYDVLVGTNRHTLTPTGWVHEQDSFKLVLDHAGAPQRVLVHERGLNTYTRIEETRLSAAAEYWARTALFWSEVRQAWTAELASHEGVVQVEAALDGRRLNDALFGLADEYADKRDAALQPRLRDLIAAHIHHP